jgi:rare lipoprotein A
MAQVSLCIAMGLVVALPSNSFATNAKVSWYNEKNGTVMADGKKFNRNDETIAASRTLPFGTRLKITNPKNGRELEVVVHDRGPFVRDRRLDITLKAAEILGFREEGVARLEIETLD